MAGTLKKRTADCFIPKQVDFLSAFLTSSAEAPTQLLFNIPLFVLVLLNSFIISLENFEAVCLSY
jgi:hypothetical protein